MAVFQSTYLKEWYTNGLQRHRAERRAGWSASADRLHRQRALRPARGRRRAWSSSRPTTRKYGITGRQALHGRVVPGLARLEAERRGGEAVLRQVRRARHQEHPRPQGPDDLAAGQGRVRRLRRRPRGDRLQRPAQLHRRARRPAADRGLLLHGDAGAQRLRRASSVVIGGLMHARPRFFAKVMGELLFWVGEDKMLFGSDYAIWEPKWQVEGFVDWEMPGRLRVRRLPAPGRRGQEEDPRPQRGQAVRRRGPGGVAAARCRRTSRPSADDAQLVGVAALNLRPRSSRRSGRSTTPSSTSRSPRSASSAPASWPAARWRCACGCPRRSARRTSRS